MDAAPPNETVFFRRLLVGVVSASVGVEVGVLVGSIVVVLTYV